MLSPFFTIKRYKNKEATQRGVSVVNKRFDVKMQFLHLHAPMVIPHTTKEKNDRPQIQGVFPPRALYWNNSWPSSCNTHFERMLSEMPLKRIKHYDLESIEELRSFIERAKMWAREHPHGSKSRTYYESRCATATKHLVQRLKVPHLTPEEIRLGTKMNSKKPLGKLD